MSPAHNIHRAHRRPIASRAWNSARAQPKSWEIPSNHLQVAAAAVPANRPRGRNLHPASPQTRIIQKTTVRRRQSRPLRLQASLRLHRHREHPSHRQANLRLHRHLHHPRRHRANRHRRRERPHHLRPGNLHRRPASPRQPKVRPPPRAEAPLVNRRPDNREARCHPEQPRI